MVRVLVTGANGFVGGHVVRHLATLSNVTVRASVRGAGDGMPAGVECVSVGDLDGSTNWGEAIRDVDAVVHCAARVHVMTRHHTDLAADLAAYERVNVAATIALAKAASASGCRRFVFLSSIKVNGESTTGRSAYSELDAPAPADPYGVSKLNAERALFNLSAETGMEVVVIRPPLVYGPGVKANFLRLMAWVRRGVPLPLGKVANHRSLVGIDNLVDLITTCVFHSAAAGQVFLVSDGEDVSTAQLVQRMAQAMGVPARLVPVPARLLVWVARLLGRGEMIDRLCGDLRVDIRKARTLLGWEPPVSLDDGLKRIALATDAGGVHG